MFFWKEIPIKQDMDIDIVSATTQGKP